MQFVPANKLSSHREKRERCPLGKRGSSDGEFSSGGENRPRANHFFVRIWRFWNEKIGKFVWKFLFSSFAATVHRQTILCLFYRILTNVEKGQPKRLVRCVTCPTFIRIAYRAARRQKQHLPTKKNGKGVETKIQIKSLYTSSYNIFSLPTINLCNGIYHFNFRHIGNTLVTVFFILLLLLWSLNLGKPHSFFYVLHFYYIYKINLHSLPLPLAQRAKTISLVVCSLFVMKSL